MHDGMRKPLLKVMQRLNIIVAAVTAARPVKESQLALCFCIPLLYQNAVFSKSQVHQSCNNARRRWPSASLAPANCEKLCSTRAPSRRSKASLPSCVQFGRLRSSYQFKESHGDLQSQLLAQSPVAATLSNGSASAGPYQARARSRCRLAWDTTYRLVIRLSLDLEVGSNCRQAEFSHIAKTKS